MWRHALIAGGLAVLAASAPALAQDDGPQNRPMTERDDRPMTDRDEREDRDDRERPEERRGPPGPDRGPRGGHAGMGPHGGHGPMMMGEMTTGFVLDLGDDRALRVFCGDEPIGTCMEAVRPLIDQVPALME